MVNLNQIERTTREEHIGLWGELHVFRIHVAPSSYDVVNFWVGPNQKNRIANE